MNSNYNNYLILNAFIYSEPSQQNVDLMSKAKDNAVFHCMQRKPHIIHIASIDVSEPRCILHLFNFFRLSNKVATPRNLDSKLISVRLGSLALYCVRCTDAAVLIDNIENLDS